MISSDSVFICDRTIFFTKEVIEMKKVAIKEWKQGNLQVTLFFKQKENGLSYFTAQVDDFECGISKKINSSSIEGCSLKRLKAKNH